MERNMNEMPFLDQRLKTISEYVDKDSVAADIGTDHAYLVAYLAATGKIKKAYACDINILPIKNAEKTVEKYNLWDKISCILTDGLNGLPMDEIDDIIIAGMGGNTIIAILEACRENLKGKKLILQPMTKFEHLREYLITHGFQLKEEHPVVSGKFVYTLMICEKNGKSAPKDRTYKFLGEIMNSPEPEKFRYLKRIYINISRRLEGLLKTAGHEEEKQTYREVLEKIENYGGVNIES